MKCPICAEETAGQETQQWGPELAHKRCVKAYSLGGCDARAAIEAQRVPDVDALANFIREIDGAHRFGAGALAEKICEWLSSAPPVAQPAERKSEQAAFEEWLHRVCPSGDVTEVQRQWEASSEYADLLDYQVAPKPMTWREASTLLSEHLEGEMTGDDYIIVKAVERFHGIGD